MSPQTDALDPAAPLHRLGSALRATLRAGYGWADFRQDRRGVKVVVLDVTAVPAVDATGLLNLQSLVTRLNTAGIKVILAGVQPQPMRAFARARWRTRKGRLRIFRSFQRGIDLARATVAGDGPPPSRTVAADPRLEHTNGGHR